MEFSLGLKELSDTEHLWNIHSCTKYFLVVTTEMCFRVTDFLAILGELRGGC